MRKILFCNIAWMKFYKGVTEDDKPVNGGAYVTINNDAHEAYNFDSINFIGDDTKYCLGFVETKSTNGRDRNQLHIEKIGDYNVDEDIESVDDVLVIWCAKSDSADFTSVVGWYKNATVYRNYESVEFDDGWVQYYNITAKSKDCLLLPSGIRHRRTLWYVSRVGKRNGPSYGFGQANVWFVNNINENKSLNSYLEKIVNQIENYEGENWVNN